mgnify:CR=1 FL=1
MKKIMEVCIFLLLFANNFLVASEAQSFITQEEQVKYAKALIEKLSQVPKSRTVLKEKDFKSKEDFISWGKSLGKRGKFVIVGKIIDEHGNLLQDVCVLVTKSISGIWESKEIENTYVLSNYFVISSLGCDSVYISLSKDGYIPMVTNYYYGYNSKLFNKAQKNSINITDNLITGDNLVFVMKKKGELPKLQIFKGNFLMEENKKINDIFLIKSWKKSTIKESIDEPYLQINSKKDVDNFNESSLELVNANPEDGFIVIDFDENAVTYKNFWNLMGEAPQIGYSIKSFKILKQLGTPTFFYYFINGKYGKGYIYRDGRLILFQNNEKNPEQKRNLWTN